MATVEDPLTAEEFARMSDPGYPEGLIEGRIVAIPPPRPRHGFVCGKVDRIIGNYLDEHTLVRVLPND